MPTDPVPQVGEVWFAEMRMIEKSRPVLVLSYPTADHARALAVVAPLTSQIRGMTGEIDIGKPRWLPKHSAVNVQGVASLDKNSLKRKMGNLTASQLDQVRQALRDLLQL